MNGAALAGLLLSVASASCVRDGGEHYVLTGTVNPDLICRPDAEPADPGGCPPCSSLDARGSCPDRFYAAGFRCASPGDGRCEARGGRCVEGYCVLRDDDRDGLDDDLEREVATRNLPALAVHPGDRCGTPRGIVYRVARRPEDARRLAVTYVVLYDRDCGSLNGHLGDDESFAVTVDLDAEPGPAATVGVATVAHRHTSCESISSCEAPAGTSACAPPGADRVQLYASRDKHAVYFDMDVCARNCFDECAPSPPIAVPLVDVGQPDAPLVSDLSAPGGIVSVEGGWEPALLHFDPWSRGPFGGAGNIRSQLLEIQAPPGTTP